jgi:hypothetical protein
MPDGDYMLTVESLATWRRRQRRTDRQNSLMWVWFGDLAHAFNALAGQDYWTSAKVHDYLCAALGSDERSPEGLVTRVPVKTSRLNTQALSDFLTRCQAHLAEELHMDCPLPTDPDYNAFLNTFSNL